MRKYAEWAPTGFDPKGLNGEYHGISNFYVLPVIRTRDSNCLEESNFDAALEIMGGEQEDRVEVHRFGHWANGWFEIIVIHPELLEKGHEIEAALENYPVLDEDDWSEREWKAKTECWDHMSLSERIRECAYHKISIFAARHDEIPEEIEQSMEV